MDTLTVDSKKLEHGCRMIFAGLPPFCRLGLEDGHVPTFWFLLYNVELGFLLGGWVERDSAGGARWHAGSPAVVRVCGVCEDLPRAFQGVWKVGEPESFCPVISKHQTHFQALPLTSTWQRRMGFPIKSIKDY